MTRITAAVVFACIAGSSLSQQTITVPDDYPTLGLALNPGVSGLAPGDTIELRDTVAYAGTFTVITPDITIREAAGDTVVIDAFTTGSVFTIDTSGGSVTFEDLTIQNGQNLGSGNNGGGINNISATELNIVNCEFNNNAANIGGAVYAGDCNLTIVNSSFTGNVSSNYAGAVRSTGNSTLSTVITNSTFSQNAASNGNGGAIDHAGSGASITISGSSFNQNTCTDTGAGVYVTQANTAIVTDTDFFDNVSLGETSQDTGGLYLNQVGLTTVKDCDFERNLCAGSGGGLRLNNTPGDVIDCRFIENEASSGGAIQAVGSLSNVRIYNCIFDGNSARRTGNDSASGAGAIVTNSFATTDIYNSLFINNTAVTGGAISSLTDGEVRVYNSTFTNNDADSLGGAIRRLNVDAIVFVNNSIFSGNLPTASQIAINGQGDNDEVNYSLVEGGYTAPGVGNIDANPMFVDASNDDYSLMAGSPAIDAGSSARYVGGPLSDLAGNDRGQDDPDTADTGEVVIGAVIDMGAYEFDSGPAAPDCPADQNFDGIVSPADFSAWVSNYNAGCD